MAELEIGQTVQLSDGRVGVVRFVGQPHFAPGEWVGVELDDGTGKNDGSVQGERYFECDMGKGMFLRPSAVEVIEPPPPPAPKPNGNATVKRAVRPSSVVAGPGRRMSAVPDAGAPKRMSMNAPSPSPATRMSRPSGLLRSPTKSPTKQLASTATSGASTPRTSTPSATRPPSVGSRPRPSITGSTRTSMGPPPAPVSKPSTRQSLLGTSGNNLRSSGALVRPAPGRTSLAPRTGLRVTGQRLNSIGSAISSGQASEGSGHDTADEELSASPTHSERTDLLSPGMPENPVSPVLSRTSAADKQSASPVASSRGTASPATTRPAGGNTAASREIEDLKRKLRLMEKKRMEDRDKLKSLEKIQVERDKFESVVQKLQTKYQPQQQEITDLRKQLKESAMRFEEIENVQAEHDVVLEMATLDREMAEETAEVLKHELETLKQKTEELELEVEVLREENAELGGEMSPEEKTSQGWLQLERNNERLREALLRLRDITQQQEEELRDQIKSLEEDVRGMSGVKSQYDTAKERLGQSEATVEDLRQQLDNALGAEDMIEELTEKNMSMSEQIEELKATIEDLESLKELNDELEINHVETEKEMQEDLDFKDNLIGEQNRRAVQQDETLGDMEYTLSKFRELVTSLQTDLEDMKASHAVTEIESEQLSSRSRAMMDLNMKLQVSAAKTQVKAIDLELRRLDAQEASDHLAIVQLFLPEAFKTDRDSVLALLRFKRVGFKANLLHGFVKERFGGQSLQHHQDDMFAAFDMLDKLSWVVAMCDRFVNAISHCTTEQFAKYEGAMYELEPVERALNSWIDGLRRDDIKEKQCANELNRTIALLSHLAEVHISDGLESFADDVHMRALVIQSHLESTAAAITAAKTMVQSRISVKGDENEFAEHFAKRAEIVVSQTRSAKVVVGKAVRSLEDLKTRSLSLLPDTMQNFEQCEAASQELAKFSRQVGEDLLTLLQEEGRIEPVTYLEVQNSVYRTTSSVLQSSETDLFSTLGNKLRTLTNWLNELAGLATDLDKTQEFERETAPWVIRSQELKSSRTVPIDAEEEMTRLKEETHERARIIAIRDRTLEEFSYKIELLESRMRDATKKNDRITELEKKIEETRRREVELSEAMEGQVRELIAMEADREKWKKLVGDTKAINDVPGAKAGQEQAVATAREMQTLHKEVASLQAAVRYLRSENSRLRFHKPENTDWLHAPLAPSKTRVKQQTDLLVSEGQAVLDELLHLSSTAELYDLKTVPTNKLTWRPAKSTSTYHVAKQREDFEAWNSWQASVTKKGQALLPKDEVRAASRSKRPVAFLGVSLPDFHGKKLPGSSIEIVEPNDFDFARNRRGLA